MWLHHEMKIKHLPINIWHLKVIKAYKSPQQKLCCKNLLALPHPKALTIASTQFWDIQITDVLLTIHQLNSKFIFLALLPIYSSQ